MPDPFPSSGATGIDGCDEDLVLYKSEFLTRDKVLKCRTRLVRQVTRIYRDQYSSLMEELKLKYREYHWEYGKSPLQEEENQVRSTQLEQIAPQESQRLLLMLEK